MSANEEYIRKNKIVIVDDDKNTRLHYAAALGNLDETKKIVESGQKLDPENYLGWTPLMMAVRNANMSTVELLLASGADATKKNKFGMSVFLISLTSGDIVMVEKILNHLFCGGVSRQALQKEFSPIALAILFKQGHIFKFLLHKRFDLNMATPLTGITPLMFAAAMGNQKATNRLLQHHADPSQRNYLGKTATDIMQSRHKKIDIDRRSNFPMIVVTNDSNSPHLQLTPYPDPTGGQSQPQLRKSSNTRTPMISPAITPITPQMVPHQMFFGPSFTPSQFISPAGCTSGSNTPYDNYLNSAFYVNAEVNADAAHTVNNTALISPMISYCLRSNYCG